MIRNSYSTDGVIIYPKYSANNITVMSDPNSELNNRFTLTKPAAGAMTMKNVTDNDLGFQITILCASAM